MPTKIKVHEEGRDDEYGTLRKKIDVVKTPPFETPTKCIKKLEDPIPTSAYINEVTKKINLQTIESFQEGEVLPRNLRKRFIDNKLNLTIFDLMFNSVPSYEITKALSNYWYVCSENTLVLPTVKSAMLKENNKWSLKRITACVAFFESLIDIAETINYKPFIGTIPLLPPKFSKPFVKLYLDKGFNAFAIDVGARDLINHVADLRAILLEINPVFPLNEVFIYACNMGIPRFTTDRARADDFLSLFAYIDAFGNIFKSRGGAPRPDLRNIKPQPPKAKQFLRTELNYQLLHTNQNFTSYNQREQIKETNFVRELIGIERMQKYLERKKGVDETAFKHLNYVMEKVKIK